MDIRCRCITTWQKTKDTLDYYQLNLPNEEVNEEEVFDINDYEEVEIQNLDTTTIKLEKTIDPLDMPDSIYNKIWRVDEEKYNEVFGNGIPTERYFYITKTKENLDRFINAIDPSIYKLKKENKINDYYIDEFLVINLRSKDTFRCSIKALDDGRFEFLSQSSLNK